MAGRHFGMTDTPGRKERYDEKRLTAVIHFLHYLCRTKKQISYVRSLLSGIIHGKMLRPVLHNTWGKRMRYLYAVAAAAH
jgi:hypothetical protein